ncbi:MAG: DNA-3-methyladenine glycosylase [Fimbriimonadaceae bacterium]|nr:DNA-3-methyladenine glycosylase [Fimbriimonadaceae bacterium]
MSTILLRHALNDLPVEECAKRLLGWHLRTPDCLVRIAETEAYGGTDDPGSHAWRGETPRTRVMFGPPGHAFVYFTYGNHWMLNVVARPVGRAGAILIRAAVALEGEAHIRSRRPKAKSERDLLAGPGRLAQALAIRAEHYGLDLLSPSSPIHLEPGDHVASVLQGVRVGLSPGRGEHTPWRFVDAGAKEWCSRPVRGLEPA